ncbi:MAG: S-layer homology domain-containing protein, partial [Tissierellaceae bacterium]
MLILSSTTTAFGQVIDTEKHWAEDVVEYMVEKGIIHGYPDGSFRPENNMTRAEFYKVVNELMGYTAKTKIGFEDVVEGAWYYEHVQKAVGAKYIEEAELLKPDANITRAEVAKILGLIFSVEEDSEAAKVFADYGSIPKDLRAVFGGLVKNGYLRGYPDKTVRPKGEITRAEVVQMLKNISGEIVNKKGSYETDVEGNMVINTRDVELKNMTIEGNLYLTEGIGDGDVRLDNVVVKGEMNIKGGGENSIVIMNSKLNKVVVDKAEGKIRVVFEKTSVESVKTSNEVKLQLNDGTEIKIVELDGKIEVVVEKGAAIVSLDVLSSEIVIEAKGDIETLNAKEDVIVNDKKVEKGQEPKKVEGGQVKDSGTAPKAPATSTGTGGGSSDGGGGSYTPPSVSAISITATVDVDGTAVDVTGDVYEGNTVNVALSSNGTTIYYTTDGSEPTTGSDVYSAPLNITATTTIKAFATRAGYTASGVKVETITFVAAPDPKPVALHMDNDGSSDEVIKFVLFEIFRYGPDADPTVKEITELAAENFTFKDSSDGDVTFTFNNDFEDYSITPDAQLAADSYTIAFTKAGYGTETLSFTISDSGGVVNKSFLEDDIASAEANRDSVGVSEDGLEIEPGNYWVTAQDKTDYQTAIDAAIVIRDKGDATQEEVDDAVADLEVATNTFNDAKKNGLKPVDKSALIAAIAAAETNRDSVLVSEDGTDVPQDKKWVTQDVFDIYSGDVIGPAESVRDNAEATQAEVDQKVSQLGGATDWFDGEKKDGTKPAVVTSIAIKKAPTKVVYTEGENLELAGLEVILTYDVGDPEDVAFAQFGAKGLTTSPEDDDVLATTDIKVTITHTDSGQTVDQAITVNAVGALGGTVTITGTLKFGEELTADVSSLTGNTGTLSYQWKRG